MSQWGAWLNGGSSSSSSSASEWGPEQLFEGIRNQGDTPLSARIGLSDAQTVALGVALCLLTVVLVYYAVRCTAKALNWAVGLFLKLGVALLATVIAMLLLSVVAPWVAGQVGLEGWLPDQEQQGEEQSMPTTLDGVEYVEIVVDPATGEKMRLPKWSQLAEADSRRSWGRTGRRVLDGMLGTDLAGAMLGGRKSGWAWVGLKYGLGVSARAVVDGGWSLASGVVSTVASLARSAGEQGGEASEGDGPEDPLGGGL